MPIIKVKGDRIILAKTTIAVHHTIQPNQVFRIPSAKTAIAGYGLEKLRLYGRKGAIAFSGKR